MARILNTDDLAMAQNGLRNAMHALRGSADAYTAQVARVAMLDSLRDLHDAVMGDADILSIDFTATVFQANGYSRELGAAAYKARRFGYGDSPSGVQVIADDVRATPEWQRLEMLYAEPVTPCCDWEVPASN